VTFHDRADAGRRLAARLADWRGQDVVVLGLPRGGVPVAAEVAAGLGAALDVVVVRKLGVPHQPELAMGAVGEDGAHVLDPVVISAAGVSDRDLEVITDQERGEVDRRATLFRRGRSRVPLTARAAMLVDDGIATGSTMRAACQVVRAQGAARIVVAAPVGAPNALRRLRRDADEVICLEVPAHFRSVGGWYDDFTQTTDDEVVELLRLSAPG
jgi:putative phosphoribosyl transferase